MNNPNGNGAPANQGMMNRPPPSNGLSKGANLFVREIRSRIDAYFKISVRNVRDTIPKAIGFFLVKQSQERLQFELYAQINKNENLTKSLGEPERVAEERKSLNATLDTLKKALKVLQRDPDITNTAFGEDELAEELRMEAERRRREAQAQKSNPNPNQMNQ
jgi:vacuolar protein sorting-associated protein 1